MRMRTCKPWRRSTIERTASAAKATAVPPSPKVIYFAGVCGRAINHPPPASTRRARLICCSIASAKVLLLMQIKDSVRRSFWAGKRSDCEGCIGAVGGAAGATPRAIASRGVAVELALWARLERCRSGAAPSSQRRSSRPWINITSHSRMGERPTIQRSNDFRYAMTSAIWPGSSLNSGIDGWPVMMPSASGSSRFSTG